MRHLQRGYSRRAGSCWRTRCSELLRPLVLRRLHPAVVDEALQRLSDMQAAGRLDGGARQRPRGVVSPASTLLALLLLPPSFPLAWGTPWCNVLISCVVMLIVAVL